MTIQQVTADIASLTPSSEETLHAQIGAGGIVVLVSLTDMVATDEFILRHYVTLPTAGSVCIGSKVIEHGVTTDDTWSTTAGAADADGWQSWPLGFGDGGGLITIESTSGSYDVEFVILSVGAGG